jgi:hypothetical protein
MQRSLIATFASTKVNINELQNFEAGLLARPSADWSQLTGIEHLNIHDER